MQIRNETLFTPERGAENLRSVHVSHAAFIQRGSQASSRKSPWQPAEPAQIPLVYLHSKTKMYDFADH